MQVRLSALLVAVFLVAAFLIGGTAAGAALAGSSPTQHAVPTPVPGPLD